MPRGAGRFALITTLAVFAVAALPAASGAAPRTFVANKLGDREPGPCRRGDCTLREAIIAANANRGRDTILLRSGRRYELSRAGADDDGEAGDLDVTDRVLIRAGGRRRATIDANRIDRVLDIPTSGSGTKLERVAIRRGDGSLVGGIRAESRLELVRSTVAGNRGTNDGGILAARPLVLRNSRVVNNRGGAGVFAAGGIEASSAIHEVLIANSVVRRNRAGGVGGADIEGPATIRGSEISRNPGRPGPTLEGGGLRLDGPTSIDRSDISGNVDDSIGGIDAEGLGGTERITVRRSRIAGNRVTTAGFGDGAGISAFARLRVIRSRVVGNEAGGDGGGIRSRGARTAIVSSTIRDNRAAQPGGGASLGDTTATGPTRVRIARSTFSHNRTDADGGGLSFVVRDVDSTISAVNSTIAHNRADDDGGGIELRGGTASFNALTVARNKAEADGSGGSSGGGLEQGTAFGVPAAVVVANSLIALNRLGTGGSDPDCSGEYTSRRRNLITNRSGCGDLAGPRNLVRANPRIGRLGRHGGPTATIPLNRRSAAINAAARTAPARDQRGVRRRNPDIGAFERG